MIIIQYPGHFSSNYTFSVHDETSFDASLLLSGGEQHSEMLRTELCLQGTATYDANILTVSRELDSGIVEICYTNFLTNRLGNKAS